MSSLYDDTIFLYDETLFCGVKLYFHPTLFLNQQLKSIPQSLISPNYVAGLRLCL